MSKHYLGLKSAVIFLTVFIASCDKSQNTLDTPENKVSQLELLTESRRTKLVREIQGQMILDPLAVKTEEQGAIVRDLFEGLVIYDKKGDIIPGVAERWETQDNKTWRFFLREDAKWANGESVTAQDFILSWQNLAGSKSPLKSYLAFLNLKNAVPVLEHKLSVEKLGVSAENDRTLLIILDKPTPYLPAMLAHISLLPQYLQNSEQKVITNGAYSLTSYDEKHVRLSKNPFYWEKSKAGFSQVDYIRQSSTLGEISDLAINHRFTNLPQNENPKYLPKLCTYFYEFNLNDPTFAKSAVRKAIGSLISVKNITESEVPKGLASTQFLPKKMQVEQESEWVPIFAEQLLAENGINEQHPLKLVLSFDDEDLHQRVANRIQRQLAQSDMLRVTAESFPWRQLQERHITGEFQLIRSGWCADFNDPMAFFSLFYSKSPDNKTGYYNADFDRLFERALQTLLEKERSEIFLKLQQHVQQEHLVIPIFQYRTPIWVEATLMGIDGQNASGVVYSKDLWRKVQD
ncbi:peptide ABC transporter substrate-binding protein [Rodentibacter caecimuris]|uniref:Solute-binding protein family 5 domain-containing protein n=1 Tax=Rodentibacter caecimuris TaxID=1796644 RepID=A0ABX3KYB5_9PAST|nr:hypothetical protein BKG89_05365 [Rodentibacter heylii]